MGKLVSSQPTIDAVMDTVQKTATEEVRGYVGCSGLGAECHRQLTYQFWWSASAIFPAQTLMNFEDGHRTEALTNSRFKSTPGIDLREVGPDGRQWGVTALSGHLRGHLDGLIRGVLEAPKTWHVYEVKATNDAKFRKLDRLKIKHGEKDALEVWDWIYFVQAQLYMGLTKTKRHFLVCSTPGGRAMTSVRTEFQKDVFDEALAKAAEIIQADELPPRLAEDPEFWLCRWCQFSDLCHDRKTAKMNCRTCAHSTAVMKPETADTKDFGEWRCEFHDKRLGFKAQRKGCPKHLFRPDLIPWATVVEMDRDENRITYQTDDETRFTNCELNNWSEKEFTSRDLQHVDEHTLVTDDYLVALSRFCPSAAIESRTPPTTDGVPFNDELPPF